MYWRKIQTISTEGYIILVLIAFLAWCLISWRWYTCGIKNLCELPISFNAPHLTLSSFKATIANAAEFGTEDCPPYITKEGASFALDTDEVRKLEEFLHISEGAGLAEDGMFGRNDVAALASFQQKNVLPISGSMNAETISFINNAVCAQ